MIFLDNIRAGGGCSGQGSTKPSALVSFGDARGQAAVVVPLFVDRKRKRELSVGADDDLRGALRVILTQRAFTLRSHPGETAFPGGRLDDAETVVQAAMREFHEELGVDLHAMIEEGKAEILAVLDPQLSKHLLAVTPIVVFLSEVGALADLDLRINPAEVAAVYTAPVDLFLGKDGYECYDVDVGSGPSQAAVRVHSWTYAAGDAEPSDAGDVFRIWGLTAWILIHVATTAFQAEVSGERHTNL